MIQLKDKLKVNGGTRRYMEMIGLSLAFSLFAVSCTQDSDTFFHRLRRRNIPPWMKAG